MIICISNVYDNTGHVITDCGKVIASDQIAIINDEADISPHENLLSMGWTLSRDNEKI